MQKVLDEQVLIYQIKIPLTSATSIFGTPNLTNYIYDRV